MVKTWSVKKVCIAFNSNANSCILPYDAAVKYKIQDCVTSQNIASPLLCVRVNHLVCGCELSVVIFFHYSLALGLIGQCAARFKYHFVCQFQQRGDQTDWGILNGPKHQRTNTSELHCKSLWHRTSNELVWTWSWHAQTATFEHADVPHTEAFGLCPSVPSSGVAECALPSVCWACRWLWPPTRAASRAAAAGDRQSKRPQRPPGSFSTGRAGNPTPPACPNEDILHI